MIQIITLALILTSSIALADGTATKPVGPCEQIKETCESAGFVKGEAKKGSGLWVDCISPIMKGTAQPKNADLKLPSVDAGIISACKAKHPNFGEGGKGKKAGN